MTQKHPLCLYNGEIKELQASDSLVENIFNVKDFGAIGDGTADDRNAIRRTIYAASIVGGGTIIFPPGTYKVSGLISWIANWDEVETGFYLWTNYPTTALDNLHFVGIGVVTILSDISNTNMMIFSQVPIREGSTWTLNRTTCAKNQSFYNIIFDGNIARTDNTSVVEDALVTLSPIDGVRIEKCTFKNAGSYGISMQYNSTVVGNEKNKNITIIDTLFSNNGRFAPAGGPGDGIDIKCGKNITLINCISQNNSNSGFDIRGENVSYINCCAYNNIGSGFDLTANSAAVGGIGASAISPASFNILGGVSSGNSFGVTVNGNCTTTTYNDTTRLSIFISGMKCIDNNNDGVQFYGDATYDVNKNTFATFENCEIAKNDRNGVWLHSSASGTSTTIGAAIFNNCIIANNVSSGIFIEYGNVTINGGRIFGNGGYGIYESIFATKQTVSKTRYCGNLIVDNNTSGGVADKNIFLTSVPGNITNSGSITATVGKEVRDYNYSALDYNIKTIASAATITLPYGVDFFWITGTTAISNINGGYHGRIVTFGFALGCQFTHSETASNTRIKLFGDANKTFPANTYITFIFYSAWGWYEMQNSNIPSNTAEQTAFFDTVTMNGSSVGVGLGAVPSTNYILDTYFTTIDASKALYGGIRTRGEFVTDNPYALRMIRNNFAAILYNDGTNFELKITVSGYTYGVFDSTKSPFKVALSTGNVTFSHVVTLSSTTTSTSTITGALVVSGGVGIAGNVYIGGQLDITSNTTFRASPVLLNGVGFLCKDNTGANKYGIQLTTTNDWNVATGGGANVYIGASTTGAIYFGNANTLASGNPIYMRIGGANRNITRKLKTALLDTDYVVVAV